MEVALRNAIHNAVRADKRKDYWFELPEFDQQAIQEAKKRIIKQGKEILPGRIIAELHFSFWSSLFSKRYETKQILWPRLIKPVFPNLPKKLRSRDQFSARIQNLRKLRNRVYHYEPIWSINLEKVFFELKLIVNSINNELIPYLALNCEFEQILKKGYLPFLVKLP